MLHFHFRRLQERVQELYNAYDDYFYTDEDGQAIRVVFPAFLMTAFFGLVVIIRSMIFF